MLLSFALAGSEGACARRDCGRNRAQYAPKGFDVEVAKAVSDITGKAFVTAGNKFHALTSKDEIVFAHGALKALAADMMKIANDVRWLASGPRDGLGEIYHSRRTNPVRPSCPARSTPLSAKR